MSLLSNVRLNFGAFLIGKLFAAVVGLLLPRLLGPEEMGTFTSAWGLALLVSVFTDLGLANYLTREVSRDRSRAGLWLFRAVAIQVLQVILSALILIGIYQFGPKTALGPRLILLGFLPMAFASLQNPMSATLQGLERFWPVSVLISLASMLNAVFLGAALIWRPEPLIAFAALSLSGFLGLLAWCIGAYKVGLRLRRPEHWELWGFFRGALPFAMVSAANLLYVRVDLALLTWLVGTATLGQYGAAVKCVDLFVPLLTALGGPLYPRLSQAFASGNLDAAASLHRGMRYLTAVCLPIGIGGSLLAGPLMSWLYGSSFAPAGPAFAWLIWVPALIGVHTLMIYAINALGKTRFVAMIYFANVILNVTLNLGLVPHFGIVASAAISALCELVVMIAVIVVVLRAGIALEARRLLWPALPSAAGMATLIVFLPVPHGWEVPLWITLGASLYGVFLFILGFFGAEERGHLARLLGRAG